MFDTIKDNAVTFIDGAKAAPGTIKGNRQELVRGSVLDPHNHPSYLPERVQELRDNHAAFDREVAALKVKYGIF